MINSKSMNKAGIIILLMLPIALLSQTFEEFKAKQKKGVQQIQQDMNAWISQRDKEFENFLKTEWGDFNGVTHSELMIEPKPVKPPEFNSSHAPEKRVIQFVKPMRKNNIPDPLLSKDIDTVNMIINKDLSDIVIDEIEEVTFYGVQLMLPDLNGICPCKIDEVKRSDLSNWWKEMATTNYKPILKSALKYKDRLNLNDWGYLKLLRFIAAQCSTSRTCQELFVWFYMNKSGYDVRVAFSGNNFSLLVPIKQDLYGLTYQEINGSNYYVLNDLKSDNFKTYKKGHSRARKILDLDLLTPMQLGHDIKTRNQSLIFNLKTYLFSLDYNPNWVEFFKDYPQGELDMYFNAIASDEYKASLKKNFSEKLLQLNKEDAINFILRYVQYGFEYKTDDEQFGYEKFFFPEETLAYPFADCEDRAIYFSYLIRYLLNINVVGLQYPGHISTAVQFNGSINGSSLNFKGDQYYMADPTYIGASLGGEMYEYVNKKPQIIIVN